MCLNSFLSLRLRVSFIFLLMFMFLKNIFAGETEVIIGNIRIQALSPDLIRIEQKGAYGFEDRITFTVVDRSWPGENIEIEKQDNQTVLKTGKCKIIIPESANSMNEISIHLQNGTSYTFNSLPELSFIPGPVKKDSFWIMPDSPRLIPPDWGAIPPAENFTQSPTSDWDTGNDAADVYIFILESGQYDRFRSDFLKLTGPIPMPPLYAFGLWDSRYHPYSEETALATIQKYRDKQIPLDVFVVDTDWRVGASHGYGVNDSLFPDMPRFIGKAHAKNVKLMYNDHPEPQQKSALAPAEIQYRWDGLTALFKMGIDVWWYDRNWHTGLLEPMPGLSKEVWGMRLYHDITQAYHPDRRPLIMSNVDGIDNGFWNTPSHPASHRFPIWWTGDQKSRWTDLESGVRNGVNSGIARMMPYVNEDLGGHTAGNPEPEQYIRWLQYGAFSPIMRLHCTRGLTRYPWDFGEEAERIATEYIRLRYRLLPTLYAAARQAYEDGTPILQRCDLEWPDEPQANRDLQFLFGKDLLVVPVALGRTRDVPLQEDLLKTKSGLKGLSGEYFNNQNLEGDPVLVRVDSTINFIWGTNGPAPQTGKDHFSVRWNGKIGPFEKDGTFDFKVVSDDGVRVWIDDKRVVDAWIDQAATDYPISLKVEAGKSYPIRIEYYENGGGAQFQMIQSEDIEQIFKVWIPPGSWQDVWTGEVHQGPKIFDINAMLWQCPLFIREGGMIFSLPQTQYTSEKPWNKIIVDAYVPGNDNKTTRILYEDDGISPEYKKNAFCKTPVTLQQKDDKVQLIIEKRQGSYNGAVDKREWLLRLHLPGNRKPEKITINGKSVNLNNQNVSLITETETRPAAMPFMGSGSKPPTQAGPVLEVKIAHDLSDTADISFELQ